MKNGMVNTPAPTGKYQDTTSQPPSLPQAVQVIVTPGWAKP